MPNTIEITSEDQFKQFASQNSNAVLALNFWASWAEPCKQMNEVFDELSKKYPNVKFLKIEAENVPEVSEGYEIAAVPSFVIVKNGKVSSRINGANAPELTNAVAAAAKSASSTPSSNSNATSEPAKTEDINERIKKLISMAPVMLFMKGTPSAPRCGFSRQIVEILNERDARYSSFNILADEDVRQGIKQYSNWPSFPQLYINGELVGGLDIVKELVASGEFDTMLPKEEDLNTRLGKLVKREKVMIFIKGTPEAPRCGFSKQLVNILKDLKVKHDFFDILSDEEVRQGLKVFANWPTFPQVYINGELVGGLDITKEMIESGDFQQMVPTECFIR